MLAIYGMSDDNEGKLKYPKTILEGYPQNLRQEIIEKHERTKIGDLVQSNYPIYGPDEFNPYGDTYAGVGVSGQYKWTAEELWDREYNRVVPKGALGIVVDKSEFNSLVDWFAQGNKWWCFPEEYEIVEDNKSSPCRVSGSTEGL